MFSWSSIPRPILCLAPMAGYTDSPYRQLVKEICPGIICFTEFTSVDGLLHGNEATMRQVAFNPHTERPIVAQIFGKKPENFYKATQLLTNLGVDAIDINIGCPAKKIISSDHGSALLKNPSLAEEIVRATIEGSIKDTRLPVSIKMRIGTTCYDENNFFDFGQRMERAGASMITVHGRFAKQMYSGEANWQPIYQLKKIVKIPVIGNGDIKNGADALQKIGNLDGIMVGRGSFGNPWIFCEILAAFENKPYCAPTFEEKIPWIKKHLDLTCTYYHKWGTRLMRKHFAHYIRGFPNASFLRQQLITVESRDSALAHLSNALHFVRGLSAAPQPIPLSLQNHSV